MERLVRWLILVCSLCVFTLSALPVYSPSQLGVIQQRGYIRVGIVSTSYPPYIIYGDDGKMYGIDVELAQKIAEVLEVKVVFDHSATNLNQLLQNVYDKKDDIALSALVSVPSRAISVFFSTPYQHEPIGLLVNRIKYDHLKANTLPNFNNKNTKIGVVTGSAYYGYIQFLYPQATIISYDDPEQITHDVTSGKLDACMMDNLFVKTWLAQKPERAIRTRYLTIQGFYASYGIVANYSDPVLGQWLNNFVQTAVNIVFIDMLLKKYTNPNSDYAEGSN